MYGIAAMYGYSGQTVYSGEADSAFRPIAPHADGVCRCRVGRWNFTPSRSQKRS